jgi:hypothetical protein
MMRSLRQKANPTQDEEFYRRWRQDHWFCQVCGIEDWNAVKFRSGPTTAHHLVKPGRSHESCNLIKLCTRDHDLAENRDWRGWINGQPIDYPHLTLGMLLTAKQRTEPQDIDIPRLEALWGRMGIELEPLPQIFLDEWSDRKRATKTAHTEKWDMLQVGPKWR